MRYFLAVCCSLWTFFAFSQPPVIWTYGNYEQSTSDEVVPKTEGLKVLITECTSSTKGLFASLKNNPQLTELQLTHVDQALLDKLFQLKNTRIKALIIEDFQSPSCNIPVCQIKTLTQLHLESKVTKTLEFAPNAFENLSIFQLHMSELTEWKGAFSSATIGLADIISPKLEQLPVMNTPKLYQYSLSASAPFPADICEMPELTLVYISTTGDSPVPPCYESFLQRDGIIEFVTFSEDEAKRTVLKSQATLDFERDVQENSQRQQEQPQKE